MAIGCLRGAGWLGEHEDTGCCEVRGGTAGGIRSRGTLRGMGAGGAESLQEGHKGSVAGHAGEFCG